MVAVKSNFSPLTAVSVSFILQYIMVVDIVEMFCMPNALYATQFITCHMFN